MTRATKGNQDESPSMAEPLGNPLGAVAFVKGWSSDDENDHLSSDEEG